MRMRHARGFWLVVLTLAVCFGAFGQTVNKNGASEFPFDFFRNQIVLQVKIAGRGPYNMLLDTGTNPSAVDMATAKELGLKLGSTAHRSSGGGTDPNVTYVTKLENVEVGTVIARKIDAGAIDLSKIGDRMGKPVHGILGQSFLKDRIVQIDYPHRVVRFFDKSPFAKTAGQPNTASRTTVSFIYDDDVLIAGVSINGKPMIANLDTGSSGIFQLSPAAITILGLEDDFAKAKVGSSVGYNGQFENRVGKLKNVTIGGISVDSPDVTFFGKGTGHDKVSWRINIGNIFLKDYILTIDYRGKTITLEKP